MPSYAKGKIYKLQCDDGHYYIGSTCDELRRRLWTHKADSNRRNTHIYQHINQLGWDRVRIILVEEYPCENRDDLRKKEDQYIQQHINDALCLNFRREKLTEEERVEQHRQLTSVWEKNNREKRNQRRREAYQTNRTSVLQRNEEYRQAHKEQIKAKQKERYDANKEEICRRERERYAMRQKKD